ncbi:MAG: NAD(+) synthase [Sulfurovum sp.]|nr:NAD(+) synthase [Sulfurovum sp.]
MPVLKAQAQSLINNRVKAIQDYHKEAGIERAQLDVSGGLDSAVMLGLLSLALGPENITAVYTDIDSSKASAARALEVAKTFGVTLCSMDLSEIFGELVEECERSITQVLPPHETTDKLRGEDATILGSFRSCIRAPIGRFMNRLSGGGIRHGTGNECEDRWLRFYQKGGDGEVDTNPLAMLSKGEVYQLGVALGVPRSILEATPSPDLQGTGEAGHNDEDELKAITGLGWTYSRVDPVTGEYTSVGTIEGMSRLADQLGPMFSTGVELGTILHYLDDLYSHPFDMFSKEDQRAYILSARSVERSTHHKYNPNLPSLGNREQLLEQGILTNELPDPRESIDVDTLTELIKGLQTTAKTAESLGLRDTARFALNATEEAEGKLTDNGYKFSDYRQEWGSEGGLWLEDLADLVNRKGDLLVPEKWAGLLVAGGLLFDNLDKPTTSGKAFLTGLGSLDSEDLNSLRVWCEEVASCVGKAGAFNSSNCTISNTLTNILKDSSILWSNGALTPRGINFCTTYCMLEIF